jgi:octaprenyl-diphosphate synthase
MSWTYAPAAAGGLLRGATSGSLPRFLRFTPSADCAQVFRIMIALNELCPHLAPELEQVAAEIAAMAAGGGGAVGEAVSDAVRQVATTPGKRLRSGMVLLAARACGYDGPRCIVPAAVIEVLHVVSLVHDDVMDGADTRRGVPAARALWGNKMAVLLGDHLLAGALKRLAQTDDHEVTISVADAAMEMCRGQIQEITSPGRELTEAQYLGIVSAKTGSLFAASARLGAIAAGAGKTATTALDAFGRRFGIAYQIADDILDLTASAEDTGKSVARDLAQGHFTLPVIYSLRAGVPAQRAELLAALDGAHAREADLARVRQLIADTGGFEYASERAQNLADEAADQLMVLPESPARECLAAMARRGFATPATAGG